MPWSEEEDRVLKAGVEETTGENGTKDWEAVGTLLQQAGFFRTGKQARHRYARILNGQKKPGRNKCLVCGQPKKGHSCSSRPTDIVATGLSAAQIRKGRRYRESQGPVALDVSMLPAPQRSSEYKRRKRMWDQRDFTATLDALAPRPGSAISIVPPSKWSSVSLRSWPAAYLRARR